MKKIMISFTLLLLLVSGCSTNKEKETSVDLKNVLTTILDDTAFELPASMEVDDTMLQEMYGINKSDVKQYAIAFPMMNVQATEIILIESKEDTKDTVKKALDTRMKTVEETWSTYLPAQYELVQNRKTYTKGNITVIVIAEQGDAILKSIKDALS